MQRSWQTMQDGEKVFLYAWIPDEQPLRGVVHIVHGMAEHGLRYERFASRLYDLGYAVYAHDHRGNGQSAKTLEKLGHINNLSFEVLVDDIETIRQFIIRAHGEQIKYFVFGHSMGSFISLRYAQKYSEHLAGLILCGSNGSPSPLLYGGMLIATMQINYHGHAYRSKFLDQMMFGMFNKKFAPTRTTCDWLTRDANMVDEYIADPYCGFVGSASFYRAFYQGLHNWYKRKQMKRIRPTLPVYLIAGDHDPVGEFGKGVQRLKRQFHAAGVQNVDLTLYREARHELLNELNHSEVEHDVVNWLAGTN
jgi:alpha-beta hydrolase superfamily lysophospholipase